MRVVKLLQREMRHGVEVVRLVKRVPRSLGRTACTKDLLVDRL